MKISNIFTYPGYAIFRTLDSLGRPNGPKITREELAQYGFVWHMCAAEDHGVLVKCEYCDYQFDITNAKPGDGLEGKVDKKLIGKLATNWKIGY